MIPNFKTYLKESIWSDMEDRGTGELVKIEDDINLMDREAFADYLGNFYGMTSSKYKILTYSGFLDIIYVPVLYTMNNSISHVAIEGFYENNKKVSIDLRSLHKLPEGCEGKLADTFKIKFVKDTSLRQGRVNIFPKDSSPVTNEFFIQVVEFILAQADDTHKECIYHNTKESIWSDMQDRGSGEIERKEDDINNLDPEGLCDYIKDNYEFHTHESWPIYVFQKMYNPSETTMCVLVFFDSERTLPNVPVYITFNPVDIIFSPANMPGRNVIKYFHDDKLLDALKSSFDLVEDDKDGRNYHINPLNGEDADNKFILKVLDTFAENSRRPIIKKKQK